MTRLSAIEARQDSLHETLMAQQMMLAQLAGVLMQMQQALAVMAEGLPGELAPPLRRVRKKKARLH